MGALLVRIKAWWDMADRTQRTVTMAGAGFLAMLLLGTVMFASKPRMEMLASGLTPAEQGAVMQELQKMGVPTELNAQGMVLVPGGKVTELRARLAAAGKLSASSHVGDEQLSKLGMMTTPRVEKEHLKSILEGKLAQSIEFLDGVDTARVHITLPEDSPFVAEKKPATASVTVSERLGSPLSPETGRAIALMVANAVPGLDTDHISIVNQRGQPLYDGQDKLGVGGRIATKLETEKAEAKRRERDLQQKLDVAFGPGATVAMVNLELDFDNIRYQETKVTPSKGLVKEEATETIASGQGAPGRGAAGGGFGGVEGQTPTAVGTDGEAPGYEVKQRLMEYVATDTRTTNVEQAAGAVKTMAINVLVDTAKVKDKAKVEEFVMGYLGPKADDPNFTRSVTALEFDTSSQVEAEKASKAVAGRERTQQLISLLPIGALILVALVVLKQVSKMASSQTVLVATPDGGTMPVSITEMASAAPGTFLPLSANEAVEHAVEHASEHAGLKPRPKKRKIEEEEDPLADIEGIKDKINVPLEQIKMMSNEKPEVVAMLIKSWLLEERR
jgi:flagellar M-ring protein FliF